MDYRPPGPRRVLRSAARAVAPALQLLVAIRLKRWGGSPLGHLLGYSLAACVILLADACAWSSPEPTSAPATTPLTATVTTVSPTAEEMELAALAAVPEHMVYAYWDWNFEDAFSEITIDVELHNDIDLAGRNGIYLMACYGGVEGVDYYFGLQTDVFRPTLGGWGKGLIFSRWNTRDLDNARPAEDGWVQSSGHEGDFIGVRKPYDWGTGTYRLRIGSDGLDDAGQWYGVWIIDLSTGYETWAGSLRFPYADGRALLEPRCYNTIEVYGSPIAPKHVPYLKATIMPPLGDGSPAGITEAGRSPFTRGFRNTRFAFNDVGAIVYEVGLDRIVDSVGKEEGK